MHPYISLYLYICTHVRVYTINSYMYILLSGCMHNMHADGSYAAAPRHAHRRATPCTPSRRRCLCTRPAGQSVLGQGFTPAMAVHGVTYWGARLDEIEKLPRFQDCRREWVWWYGGAGFNPGWRLWLEVPHAFPDMWFRPSPFGWFMEIVRLPRRPPSPPCSPLRLGTRIVQRARNPLDFAASCTMRLFARPMCGRSSWTAGPSSSCACRCATFEVMVHGLAIDLVPIEDTCAAAPP